MHRSRIALTLLASGLLALGSTSSAQSLRVGGLDSSRSQSLQGGDHTVLTSALTNPANFGAGGVVGRAITLVPEAAVIGATYLDSIDVVFINSPIDNATPTEAAALLGWFGSGGHVVLMANTSTSSSVMNTWLTALGAAPLFDESNACTNGPMDGTYSMNAMGPAIGPFGDLRNQSLSATLSRELTLDAIAAHCAGCNMTGDPLLATYEPGDLGNGTGAIVVAGDPVWLDFATMSSSSYYNPNNLTGALNAFAWFGDSLTPGTNYCAANPNSTGAPSSISASGSRVAAQNDLTLTVIGLPANVFGFFLAGQTQGFVPNPAGSQGNLCLMGAIGRYVGPGQIKNSGGSGSFSLMLDLTLTPQPNGFVSVAAGESWNFQAWHRDSIAGSATSNFTDGVRIDFL